MKKKNIVIIVLIIITYTLVYKAWTLLIYTTSNGLNEYISEKINTYSNPTKITIEHKEVNKYIEYEGIKIEDIFSKYENIKLEENKLQYVLFKDEQIDKYFSISKSKDYKSIYINGFEKYSEEDDTNTYEKITLYNEENTKEYLNDNLVSNDIKLFEFLLSNHGKVNKLLYKKKTMKENYYLKQYILNVIPKIKKLYIFDGIDGYMFKTSSDGFEIHIENYVIKTIGINEKEIIELVRTIKINE